MISNEKINDILKIDDKNLIYELKRQPSLLFWLGNHIADLEYDLEKLQLDIDTMIASKAKKIRQQALEDGIKLTEKSLTERLDLSKNIKTKKLELLQLKKIHKNIIAAQRALVNKSSMLEQISFNKRKEMDFNIKDEAIKSHLNKKRLKTNK